MKDRLKTVYVCNACGETSPRWVGRCIACGEWNTMVEDTIRETKKNTEKSKPPGNVKPQMLIDIDKNDKQSARISTGIDELDRVLGGGIVVGSLMLLSGEPGAGKSTLLLQICKQVAKNGTVLYISGEESVRQIKLRAERLCITGENIVVATQTSIEDIGDLIQNQMPIMVVVDSIQTMQSEGVTSSAGSITQVKECTGQLLGAAKLLEIPIFIVGHVNKDGAIAGPKVMEHTVDTVLYFEGDKTLPYRILRAAKNRYGSTNEIGLFDMTSKGLQEVKNPSMTLLCGRPTGISGSCVVCTIEGSRPLFSEVQALVVKSSYATPRRTTSGFDYNRASLLLAVLEKRAGYFFGNLDVFINVIGGLQLDETATDLAVAMAVVSSLNDRAVEERMLFVGELGLGGEIRAVSHIGQRIKEAQRLGFTKIVIPKQNLKQLSQENGDKIEIIGAAYIKDAIKEI